MCENRRTNVRKSLRVNVTINYFPSTSSDFTFFRGTRPKSGLKRPLSNGDRYLLLFFFLQVKFRNFCDGSESLFTSTLPSSTRAGFAIQTTYTARCGKLVTGVNAVDVTENKNTPISPSARRHNGHLHQTRHTGGPISPTCRVFGRIIYSVFFHPRPRRSHPSAE